MQRMNLVKTFDRTLAMKTIDTLLDTNSMDDARFEEGVGRRVYMFPDYVIKVPKNSGTLYCGDYQNEAERFIWFNSRDERLNEVYMEYRGCLVCKRIETNPDVLLELMGIDNVSVFERRLREKYGSDLHKLIQAYNLVCEDIFTLSNWGYDYDTKEFKCIDYGMRKVGAFTTC